MMMLHLPLGPTLFSQMFEDLGEFLFALTSASSWDFTPILSRAPNRRRDGDVSAMRDVNACFDYAQYNSEAPDPVDANRCCYCVVCFFIILSSTYALIFLALALRRFSFLTRQGKKMIGFKIHDDGTVKFYGPGISFIVLQSRLPANAHLEPCNAVALTFIIEDWNYSMLTSDFWNFCKITRVFGIIDLFLKLLLCE